MTYGAKFTHGTRTFDLNSAEFDLFQDFSFPAADEALNIGSGTSGNRSGGKVVSKRPQDRWWAWSVRILGTSKAQTHMAARRLSAWLSQALEDASDKVYFEYRVNADIPEPIWGQHGAAYRWEVKAAIVDMDGSYYVAGIPENAIILPISLLVAPYALGKKQLLAQAKGHVFEDIYGTEDGVSRGTIVNIGLTNLITNPSFETNTTSWTAIDSTIERTTDQAWVGSYGMRVTVSTTNTAAIVNIVGNTGAPLDQIYYTGSLQVYIPDEMIGKSVVLFLNESGGASAAAPFAISTQSFTTSGWHHMFCTGEMAEVDRTSVQLYFYIVAATTTHAGSYVILDAVQMVAGPGDDFPYVDGDQIGCSWTGTAHASSSAATNSHLRIPTSGLISTRGGSICMAIKHFGAASGASYDRVLFHDDHLIAYIDAETSHYIFSDDTNSIASSAAQTFVRGDIDVLHFVWSPATGLAIYLNGAAHASGATLTAWTVGTYLYIGSSSTPALYFAGTFMDFTIWDKALSAAEILADYNDISDHVRGGDGYGQRLSAIPCLWTKDGDNVVDNYTDATHNHYAVATGIPGTVEAETEINGTPGTEFNGLNLSNFASRAYIPPSTFFADSSGTGVADTVGGEARVTSLGTSGISLDATNYVNFYKNVYPELCGVQFYMLARIKDAAAGYIRTQPYVASSGYAVNTSQEYSLLYSTTTTFELYRSSLGITQRAYDGFNTDSQGIQVYGKRNTGTANITLDYAVMFPRPYLYKYMYAVTEFKLMGKDITWTTGGITIGLVGVGKITGDAIEFVPNKYNIFQTLMGYDGENPAMTYTMTYVIYCTPRYALI